MHKRAWSNSVAKQPGRDLEIADARSSRRAVTKCALTEAKFDPRAGRKGLFTSEIEEACAAGEIDVAVHSAKDLPSDAHPTLEICATLPRAAS